MMRNLCRFLVVVVCVVGTHAQLSPVVQALVKNMQSMQDTTADPCTDFYQYACGTYVKNNPIPANQTEPEILLPTITGIMYGNDAMLAKIVNDPWPIINDIYLSCLEPNLQKNLANFFSAQVRQIDGVNVQIEADLWQLLGDIVARFIGGFFAVYVEVNEYQISSIDIVPAGNSLDVSGYTDPAQYKALLQQIQASFELFESTAQAQADAVAVAVVEEFIAQSQDGVATNISVAGLTAATKVNFGLVLEAVGVVASGNTFVNVENIAYFAKLSQIATVFPPRSVQRFLQWKIYQFVSTYNVSACWDVASPPSVCFEIMQNSPYPAPWDQPAVCRNFVHMVASDYVGLVFTYEVVTPDVVGGIRNMTTGIQQAFNKSLPALGWLDKEGVAQVQFKLGHVIQIIGHPNVMDKYANLTTSATNFYQNFYDVLAVDEKFFRATQSAPFNRSDFEFDPMVVNAFYSPTTNTINFPAGILESPMFSGSWPKLFQHARLGYVVGHENTHGFDNSGSEWNAYGLPGDLFDAATRANFDTNAQCIVDFYSQYVVFNTTHLNGEQTLGENIADIGGVKNSFRAYQAYVAQNGPEFGNNALIPGLSTDQVFFLFMGQTWCASANAAYAEEQYYYDVHSPAKFRVNGPLSQFDQFAAAYSCPKTAPMNPTTRCDLW